VAAPEDVDVEDTGDGQMDAGGNQTDTNETGTGGNESVGGGNGTDAGGNETGTGGNETQTGGNETEAEDGGEQQPSPEQQVDVPTPDEQPWQWREVMFEGGENGRLNRFLQAFGRDADGELYVLASRTGRLEGADGEIYRLVPAGEGESIEPLAGETPQPGAEGEDEAGDGANETAANETAMNETATNETAGNATETNATATNETAENETAGNESSG